MKIFTEKGFEMRMEREMMLREKNRLIEEELRNLHKQIDELRWEYESARMAATKVNTECLKTTN